MEAEGRTKNRTKLNNYFGPTEPGIEPKPKGFLVRFSAQSKRSGSRSWAAAAGCRGTLPSARVSASATGQGEESDSGPDMSLALVQAYSSDEAEQEHDPEVQSSDAESDVDGAPSAPTLAQPHTAASPIYSATDAPLNSSSSLLPSADTVFSEVSK